MCVCVGGGRGVGYSRCSLIKEVKRASIPSHVFYTPSLQKVCRASYNFFFFSEVICVQLPFEKV